MWEYEINVAKSAGFDWTRERHRYVHECKIVLGAIASSEKQARAVLQDYRKRFPESEGYKLSLTRWQRIGETLED